MKATMAKRADWSRRLPRPLVIPKVTTLRTLGDVRTFIERRLPASYREKEIWQIVAAKLAEASRVGDCADVSLTLRIVLSLGAAGRSEGRRTHSPARWPGYATS
jgi:hypothetical protein